MKTLVFALLAASSLHAATQITWKRQQLHGDFYSEGAAIGDINGDGKPDIVAGPFWWEGPAFEKKHAYYEPKVFSINGYSDNFFAYVHDFNADQKNDILILGFPGKEARLYLNVERTFQSVGSDETSSKTRSTYWPIHIVADVVDNESPVFTDITGDGKPEIVCSTGGRFGWFAPNWANPTEKWPFVAVTDDMKVAKFTHGLGVGDVNGDGKLDLLEARRWWEAPSAISNSKSQISNPTKWQQHNFAAGVGGGAQMFAYDFDGNGMNDVFTALAAHRYGVAVFLQNKTSIPLSGVNVVIGNTKIEQSGTLTGGPTWTRRMLASEQPQDNDYGIVFSQPHAAHLADIDGDGIKDIVTGKRYWAHNGHDPDERGHRVIYWYQTVRDGKGGVDFIPHLVDAESGVGVDVQVGDVNGDTLPDIVVGNKAGVYILTQQRKEDHASRITPQKLYGPALKPQAEYAKGQSAQDALKSIQLPTGFKAELIAAEPDVVQPIAFTFDERGRIWVVEGNSYPQPREVGKGQDRIKILEDKDGDGTFETKKVFCEGLNLVSGIELGFGGVWVGAAPYLMFIPRDGDVPFGRTEGTQRTKGTPEEKSLLSFSSFQSFPLAPGLSFTAHILLDGWGTQDTHETLNSFIWGPDGWLYGCHGVFTHSRVGKPGTPDAQREPINAGVWRYHPVRHEFEVFAHGTSNPWGLDYDQHGEWFVTACVIPHLYHIVPGGRYHRQAGQHFNAYTYEDIKTIADHAHYAGNPRPDVTFDKTTGAGVMNNDTNALGGGHAHCGLAIYQSSLFPPTYRNQLLFGNLHGHRLVANYTDVKGSTYIGKHAADFMRANDMHFIPVTQKVGPDGALYVSDWSDQQICHRGSGAVEHWDRSNGRIYRVTYRSTSFPTRFPLPGGEAAKSEGASWKTRSTFPSAPFDLAKESDEALAKLAVQTENEWYSRMARRVLIERKANGPAFVNVSKLLKNQTAKPAERLRALWLLDCLGGYSTHLELSHETQQNEIVFKLDIPMTVEVMASEPSEHVRAGKVRRYLSKNNMDVSPPLAQLAEQEKSPLVRRELASLIEALPLRPEDGQTLPGFTIKFEGHRFPTKADLATALLKHGEDAEDPMIPLLIWYGIEPVVAADAAAGLQLAAVSKMPKVTEFIYRRLASESEGRNALLRVLAGLTAGTGAAAAKGDAHRSKGDTQSGKGGAPIEKGGAGTAGGGAPIEKGGVGNASGGAPIEKGGVGNANGGAPIEKGGAGTADGGAPIEKGGVGNADGGAPIEKGGIGNAKGGTPINKGGVGNANGGAGTAGGGDGSAVSQKADFQSFSPTDKESILSAVVRAARSAGKLTPPADWPAIAAGLRAGATPRTTDLVRELAALFGDAGALGHFRAALADGGKAAGERQAALSILIQAGDAGTAKVLLAMLADTATPPALRRATLQALASLKDAETPKVLATMLPKLSANELPDAVNTLASTKEGAVALLKAVEAKTVPATALSPFLARQLTAFEDAEINALIRSAWGDVNAPKADLAVRTKKYRDLLTPAALAKGDAAKGKALYMAACGQCHKLFGEGQNVGPDITGSNRADLNYLLENVLDPNAVIGKDYQLQLFTMTDGRVMGGVVKEEGAAAVKIAMMGGIEFTLPKADVKKREVSKLSTMPEGLFDALPPEQVVDLVKYLQSGGNAGAKPRDGNGRTLASAPTVPGAIEGETMKVLEITGGTAKRQGMGGFGSDWSGGAQLWWTGGKPDQKLTLALPVKEAGKYTLHGALTKARDYGVASITLDGKPVTSSFDGYNSPKVIHTGELDWGTHELGAGEHRLTFTLAPPNPDAVPANMVGLDYVRLERK